MSSVNLLLAVNAAPLAAMPVTETEPRSICRYSAFQVQLLASAPSMPAPTVQPRLTADVAKLLAATVVNGGTLLPSRKVLVSVETDVPDNQTLP